jgi:DNA-binding transcriptional regulator YhcF (GntR family)
MVNPGALPLYQQISELLIRDIAAGRLADGARLPLEREMAASLGITVGTLRRALADLGDKGLLDRVQGSGNHIRHQPAPASVYALFRLELTEGGGLPTAQVLVVDRVAKPDGLPPFGLAHVVRSGPHQLCLQTEMKDTTISATIGYGIIGCGMMGQEHLRNIALLGEGARVAAIFEPDAAMRVAAATLAPDARFSGSCRGQREGRLVGGGNGDGGAGLGPDRAGGGPAHLRLRPAVWRSSPVRKGAGRLSAAQRAFTDRVWASAT